MAETSQLVRQKIQIIIGLFQVKIKSHQPTENAEPVPDTQLCGAAAV